MLTSLLPELSDFVARARALLGSNFAAAYLQGSFALGDFDERSDVDFLIVTHRDLTPAELPALQAMHADLRGAWSRRLDGSYAPAGPLRRWSLEPRDPPGEPPRSPTWADPGTAGSPPRVYPFLYLANGASSLVRSEHDNTRVMRWTTREKGIVLAGPPARELIDEVTADELRGEIRENLQTWTARWWTRPDPALLPNRLLQAFWVTQYCRLLHTLHTGQVTSKKAASAWAAVTLDPRYRPLIERAFQARGAPPDEQRAPVPAADLAETHAFIQHAAQAAI